MTPSIRPVAMISVRTERHHPSDIAVRLERQLLKVELPKSVQNGARRQGSISLITLSYSKMCDYRSRDEKLSITNGYNMATKMWLVHFGIGIGFLAIACTPDSSSTDDESPAESSVEQSVAGNASEPPPFAVNAANGGMSTSSMSDIEMMTGGDNARSLGEFLEPCMGNEECLSSWCIPFEKTSVCTKVCIRSDTCPMDWSCALISNTPPDIVSVCTPPNDRFCGPCEQDTDCPKGRCLALDGQNICGVTCVADEDCEEGAECAEIDGERSCVPKTRSCTCGPEDTGGKIRICQIENEFGACIGRETCDVDVGWTGCTATEPKAELCNQIDDDCNGFTDDIPGLGDVCEREAMLDGEPIACTGRLVCTADAEIPVCTAEEPKGELCNFLDDDCDGETDEGFEARGEVCIVGLGTCQRVGVNECADDGASVVCSVAAGDPSGEICDSLDNDCDGNVDEGFELGVACFAGTGACGRPGVVACTDDGAAARCSAVPGMPTDEICNGLDDDCDGSADETFENVREACTAGVGACLRPGFFLCTDDGLSTECTAVAGQSTDETCNGEDDDCDGSIDEGFAGTGGVCTIGEGACRALGVLACNQDGTEVVCNAEVILPSEEACDGIDNDCDESIDEEFPDLNGPCSAGIGACRRPGVKRCGPEGADTVCTATAGDAVDETCNDADDDCDGRIDEDFETLNTPCFAGAGICLNTGVFTCSDDGLAVECTAEAGAAGVETCNNLDDDCDGIIDNGFANLNQACTVGLGACQRTGVTQCSGDGSSTECSVAPGIAAAQELCNGIDDNCDGSIDETFADLNQPCSVGIGACQRTGVNRCSGDGAGTECSVVPGNGVAELCNGIDDNCDGSVDETFGDLNQPCSVGTGACQRTGVTQCAGDGNGTECSVSPAPAAAGELCNGIDDNCDGTIDEGFERLNEVCIVGDGVCLRAGVRTCSPDGLAVECSVQAGVGGDEECNGLDDDCDGTADEEFPTVGQVCEVGQGTCRRSGIIVCNGNGDGTNCNADVVPGGQESCDYQDDDCDGKTDETFTDANGRYITLEHCGGCGNACAQLWDPSPEENGVTPTCSAAGATAVCGFTCLDGFRDADGLATNGCEFQDDPTAVYVSTPANGGVAANDCGTSLRPCSTITQGISVAFADMGKTKVLVSDGLYRETVTLQPGIDVLGGHNRVNWTRNPEINTTIIRADDTQMIHAAAVYAINITQATTLDGFAIEGETPANGNSYGVYVRDSDNSLQITNNRIRAGDGARGADGVAGASGEPGTNGAAGRNAFNLNYVTEPPAANACVLGNPADAANDGQVGGLGGQKVCNGVAASGGQGGYTSCPQRQRSEGNGFDGDGDGRAGAGGLGGAGLRGSNSGNCTVSNNATNGRNEATGATGAAGLSGDDGTGGQGAVNPSGQLDMSGHHWIGFDGGAGVSGIPGGGGGGGGGAGGVDVQWKDETADIGASGGGGGSGGCSGLGASGGVAGGGSMAVFIVFTGIGPNGAEAFPVVRDNELSRGFAGIGGLVVSAEPVVKVAKLVLAVSVALGTTWTWPSVFSVAETVAPAVVVATAAAVVAVKVEIGYDIFVGNDNGLTPDYVSDNVFSIPLDEETAGRGGSGGNSNNTVTGVGSDGVAGTSGRLLTLDD